MSDKKPTYKEIHGTTRVGDWLRSLGKSNVVDIGKEILEGDIVGAVKALLGSTELTEAEKIKAVELIKLDIAEQEGVTKRWSSDMGSDSWLSKNVRPFSLVFLTASTMLLIYLDSFLKLDVPEGWVNLLQNLLITVFFAYFGSRGYEKALKMRHK